MKAWKTGERGRKQHKGVQLVEGLFLERVVVSAEGLQVGDKGVHRGQCLEAVAGVVLNFGVRTRGSAGGQVGCAEGRGLWHSKQH